MAVCLMGEVIDKEPIKNEKFNEELKLVEDGYNFLNSYRKKKIINWCLNKIEKENEDAIDVIDYFKTNAINFIPNIQFQFFSELYSRDNKEKQISFLQELQYLISRGIVNENLEPQIIKEKNENLELEIKIVNRNYEILNSEGRIKIIDWCIYRLIDEKNIKLDNKQFCDIFIGDVDFELLAKTYIKAEERQKRFLQNVACIIQQLISLNLVDENYNQKQYVKKEIK